MTNDFETISSFQNSRIKQIKRLRDKRGREREGRFVIEYSRDLARALDCGYAVDYALFCPELADDDDRALVGQLPVVFSVSAALMQKASYRQNPNGLLTVMYSKPLPGLDDLMAYDAADTLLVLVGLRKPGNIGALLRTADAAGIKTVVLVDTALDIENPNIIRSSTGACFLNNLYGLTSDEARTYFDRASYTVCAAVVDAPLTVYDADLTGRVALMLGTEDLGLDEGWQAYAQQQIHIPMMGALTDSLNVSVSGAVLMYEALRQRRLLDNHL